VHLPGLAGRVEYAQLLNDGSEIILRKPDPEDGVHTSVMKGEPGVQTLELPVLKPEVMVPVIELFLRN